VYDDNQQIVDNPWVHSLRFLPRLLTHSVWAFQTGGPINYYRPVQMVIYCLLWSVSGGSPLFFQVANLLLHLGVVAILFFLVLRLSRDSTVATAAALLFAVHPLNTETVDWIASVPDLTYALFGLAALLAHAASWDAAPRRRILFRAASVILFLLALLSKETALVFLGLLPLMEWLLRPASPAEEGVTPGRIRIHRALLTGASCAAAAAGYVALRVAVLGALAPLRRPDISPAQALFSAPLLLLHYQAMMAAPMSLLAHHVLVPLTSFHNSDFFLSLAGVAALLAGWAWLARRAPDLAFAGAVATVPFLPVLYLPAVAGAGFAERYAYLPTAGFAWLAAGGILALAARLRSPRRARAIRLTVIGLLALSGAAATAARNPVWRDDARLATATLRAEPRAWHMHVILGNYYEREGRLEKALGAYEEGLRNFPDKPQLAAAVINVRLKLHQIGPDEAIRGYLPLARSYPSLYEIQFNLGDAYLKAGRPADAEESFRRAIDLNPAGMQARQGLTLALVAQGRAPEDSGADDVSLPPAARSRALLVQAVAGLEAGRLDEAESLLRKALALDPGSHRAYLSLAVLESRRGNDAAAMEDCRKALALRPDFADAYGQMGVSALRLGDLPEATRDLEQATRLDPSDKEGLSRLGVIYAQAGRLEEAKQAFRQALSLDPGFEKARHNLEHLESLERGKER
jgi:tetratricopeptide (TPR) repeat protein